MKARFHDTGREAHTRTVDVISDQRLHAIVGSTLAELHDADHVGDNGEIAGDSAERLQLLVGGLALVIALDDGGVEDRTVAIARRRMGHLLIAGSHAVKTFLVG